MDPLPRRFDLAASVWPRTGGDRRNSGRVDIAGPRHGRIAHVVALPTSETLWRAGGIAVAADGSVIVVADGYVTRLGVDGVVASVGAIPPPGPDPAGPDLPDERDAEAHPEDDLPPRARPLSPPVALADGTALVLAPPELLVFDAAGQLVCSEWVGGTADDSGLSPNVTHGGALVLTRMTGEVELFAEGARRLVGNFGYDIVPPAVYSDDALAIAGYATAGLVCVAADGARRWRAGMKYADLLPAIDADGFVAAGSMNEKRSIVVSPAGEVVGRFDGAAVFAEGPSGDWLARTRTASMRVRRDGAVVWSVAHEEVERLSWGAQAPVADGEGRLYALTSSALWVCDAETGAELYRVPLPSPPTAGMAIVAPGVAAVLVAGALLIIE